MNCADTEVATDFFVRQIPSVKVSQDAPVQPKAPVKVEMQTLHLNENSQKKIMDTLKYIHGPSFTLEDITNYKDKRSNLKNQFWMQRGNLVIKSACDYSQPSVANSSPQEKLRMYCVLKLQSYGFHESHCLEALQHTEDDVDQALSILYTKYHKITKEKNENIATNDANLDDLLQQRMDEKSVLESIYEDAFTEKMVNEIWVLTFKLDYLIQMFNTKKKVLSTTNKNVNYTKKKPIDKCRNFLKGHCKFGDKCRFSHQIEVAKKLDDPAEMYEFHLEIRFRPSPQYPFESPMILLKSTCPTLPPLICMQICKRLIEEADMLAEDGIVSVYSICELLKNEEEMGSYLKDRKIRFIDKDEMLFPSQKETILNEDAPDLPTHYEKGASYKNNRSVSNQQITREDDALVKNFFMKQKDAKYKQFLETRRALPAWGKMEEILAAIERSQVVVISGETGCGKSTQVPQFILDDWLLNRDGNHVEIICTQPRRLSAIGVAERVADERADRIGNAIGYKIRLESKVSSSTRLTFCTTGILLRRLEGDPMLEAVTHIIVDEVHERSDESDFLLLILRKLLPLRPDLKVILMSATLNAQLFSDYYGEIPVLEIPGRTFPVEQFFLEDILEQVEYILEENSQYSRHLKQIDNLETELLTAEIQTANALPKPNIRDEDLSIAQLLARYQGYSRTTCKNMYLMNPDKINIDLIEAVLTWIVNGDHDYPRTGSILVFLPGLAEITSVYDQLCDSSEFSPRSNKFMLLPLHSTLTSEEQSAIFRPPKKGTRKIILSTNIAETSVTIDDCVFVVDCGKMKEKRFDSNKNMESLEMVWVSRANAMQRKGRAGRVMPGVCIHLFTGHRYHNHLLGQPVPELHRIPLEQLLLKIKVLPNFADLSVHDVLGATLEPPAVENIDSAIVRLQDVGAFDHEQMLTPLGHHLAALPVDVRIGKLMLFGAIFCCVDSSLTMAACLSYKSPFVLPFSQKKQADAKKKEFAVANSDQLTVLNAYRKWQQLAGRGASAAYNFAQENYLSVRTLNTIADIKHQLLELLVSIGFVPADARMSRRSGQDKVMAITGAQMNENGQNNKLLAAILCTALYPNVVKVLTPEKSFHMSVAGAVPRQPKPEELRFKTKIDGYIHLHPSSVNFTVSHFPSPYLVYQEKVRTSRVYVRDTCMVPLLPLALFSGCSLAIEIHSGTSVLSLEDGWIMFQTETHEVAEMIKIIRIELVKLLEEKIKDPCLNLLHHSEGKKIIATIVQIVSNN